MMKTIVLFAALAVLTAPAPKNMQSPTLPFCEEQEYCLDALCACCGDCKEDNGWRCKLVEGTDCKSIDMVTNTRPAPTRMSEKERKDGSEFFKYAMKFMNDSWDWDRANPK